ncbi:Stk1 family PASTA domain-containing Ser/Thr kinase [Tomitella biformata]|uniref:Stk1 family PASTA domain-containing Ser/Thr kinase n=1 Tax=Tomitella biformata TaxID=630403 RepID=UPI0004675666|nr:Stk1 family PASTA domain-containing Ser/Thr kinase [Tomitella biformata]
MTTPQELSGRYLLGETIGFGGMSEVHLARDQRLDRDVAIKVLRADLARDPSFYLRFRREAQNAASLNHPSIVAVYDTGEADTDEGPLPYIVMEYVQGDTLRDLVRNDGPFDPRRASAVIADVCAALDFSHKNGIVHRDIKPANIMINLAGEVKVMDFGIARAMSDATSTMTQTAAVIGTAQYLSPEQARGERVDARSDIYSMGCVLFEILAGEPPFTGDSPVAVAYQHVSEEPPAPSSINPDISPELDSIVLKAMSKNPANRYQNAAEMRGDLVSVLSGQRPSAPMVMTDEERTTIFGAVQPGPQRAAAPIPAAVAREDVDEHKPGNKGLRWIAAALAVVLIAGLGLFFAFRGPDSAIQVAIPDVSGQAISDAQAKLQQDGFKTSVQTKPDPQVAEGIVINTSPASGILVDKGEIITLNLSSGPEKVAVPTLVGLTQDQAHQALTAAGLLVGEEIEHKASTEEDLDKVVGQNPSAAANVSKGSAVTLIVGSGPEQVRIPDVKGQTQTQAVGNIEGAGFKTSTTQADSAEPEGTVLSTSPAGGAKADSGSIVTITVSKGNQISMPSLDGQTISRAVDTLRAAGWTGTEANIVQRPIQTLDPGAVGKIRGQQPASGGPVAKTANVTVEVGVLGIP